MEMSYIFAIVIIILLLLLAYLQTTTTTNADREQFDPAETDRLALYITARSLLTQNDNILQSIYSTNITSDTPMLERRIILGPGSREEIRGAASNGYIASNAAQYTRLIDIDGVKAYLRNLAKAKKLDSKTAEWIIRSCVDRARYSRGYRDAITGTLEAAIALLHFGVSLDNAAVQTLVVAADAVAGMCVAALAGAVKTTPSSYVIMGVEYPLSADLTARIREILDKPRAAVALSPASQKAADMSTGWLEQVKKVKEHDLADIVTRDIWSAPVKPNQDDRLNTDANKTLESFA